jgi:hypothetical protein
MRAQALRLHRCTSAAESSLRHSDGTSASEQRRGASGRACGEARSAGDTAPVPHGSAALGDRARENNRPARPRLLPASPAPLDGPPLRPSLNAATAA